MNEKKLEEITSMNKRPKTKKKSLELLKKSKYILCSLTGDWMMTRCKEEEYLQDEMKKIIMGDGRDRKRSGKGGEEDCEKGHDIDSAAAKPKDDLGEKAPIKIVENILNLLEDRPVDFDVEEKVDFDHGDDEKATKHIETPMKMRSVCKKETKLKTPLKTQMKVIKKKKIKISSPLPSLKMRSMQKMKNTPPRTAMSLMSCSGPGPNNVKRMINLFEGGQQTLRPQTGSIHNLTNFNTTKPLFVYSSRLESRDIVEPTAEPASQWGERVGTAPGPSRPPSKPLSQWEERMGQRERKAGKF